MSTEGPVATPYFDKLKLRVTAGVENKRSLPAQKNMGAEHRRTLGSFSPSPAITRSCQDEQYEILIRHNISTIRQVTYPSTPVGVLQT